MRNEHLKQTVARAIAADLLPLAAIVPADESPPWPVLLFSALGAWLAALPFLGAVASVAGEALTKGISPYATGAIILIATLTILRAGDLPLFLEQLALPALLVGLGMFAIGLFRDLIGEYAAAVLCVIALATAGLSRRPLLQIVLGGASCALAVLSVHGPEQRWLHDGTAYWSAWMCNLALLLGLWTIQETLMTGGKWARHAAALEAIADGWAIVTLAGLALASGSTFLLGQIVKDIDLFDLTGNNLAVSESAFHLRILSCALAIASAALLARQWPQLRRPWMAGVALILMSLAGFSPFMGAALLLTAHAASRGRWRLAAAGALAIAWIVGSLYYRLDLSLATKAVLLCTTGALLGALAWRASDLRPLFNAVVGMATTAPPQGRRWGVAFCLLATLAMANVGIWRNEQFIAHGAPVYMALVPVDPRSLVQGDYMALRFAMPDHVAPEDNAILLATPFVVAKRDARGIATVVRSGGDQRALAPGEFLIELSHNARGWAVVSDAWYFKEGEGERWSAARYGEFRVAPSGKALLVGLRDARLKAL